MAGLAASTSARADVTVTVSLDVRVAERFVCPAETGEMAIGLGPSGGALVAWLDYRSDYVQALLVARVDANGALLDASGIYLADAALERPPAVAFDGTSYLVAWSSEKTVYAARVGTDGSVLGAPVAIAAGGRAVGAAGAAGQFLVTWPGANDQVLATRVASDGGVLDPTPLVLGSGALVGGGPSAIFDGTNYVVVWAAAGIHVARVSTAGMVVAPGQVDLIPQGINTQNAPAIVFSGSEYLVVWGTNHMRVSSSMAPLDSPQSYSGRGGPPAVAFDGMRYTIAHEYSGASTGVVGLTNVSTTNGLIGFTNYDLPGPAYDGQARLVFNGTQLLLGFVSGRIAGGARVATNGTVLDATPLTWSQTQNDQRKPAVAFDGANEYLVAWIDSRNTDHQTAISVARLTETGGLDGTGILVRNVEGGGLGVAVGRARTPGSTSLVVWDEGFPAQLRAARIAATGEVLDPGGFRLLADAQLDEAYALDVACTTRMCLVAWVERDSQVLAMRVDLAGTVIDTTPIELGRGDAPRVTAADDAFLVAGGRWKLIPEVGAPQQLMLPTSIGLFSWDIEWDGNQFLVVWTELIGEQLRLKAIRIDRNGVAFGGELLIAEFRTSVAVNIIHDGAQWIVTWSEGQIIPAYETIRVARITADGVLRDPSGVEVPIGAGARPFAGSSDGRFMAVRQVFTAPTPDRGTYLTATWVSITGDNPIDDTPDGSGCCRTDRGDSGPTALVAFVVAIIVRRRRLAHRSADPCLLQYAGRSNSQPPRQAPGTTRDAGGTACATCRRHARSPLRAGY